MTKSTRLDEMAATRQVAKLLVLNKWPHLTEQQCEAVINHIESIQKP